MKLTKVLLCSAVLFAIPAFAESEGEAHTETTDKAGTTVTHKESGSDTTSILGTRKIEAEAKKVTDPKGLMNKTTEKAAVKTKIEKDGDRTDHETSVDAAGTKRDVKTATETDKNSDGTSTTTTTKTTVTDPKGLGNKEKHETETEVTHDAHGTTLGSKATVDGKTVAETGKH